MLNLPSSLTKLSQIAKSAEPDAKPAKAGADGPDKSSKPSKPGHELHQTLKDHPEQRDAVYRQLTRTEPALIHHLEQWRLGDEKDQRSHAAEEQPSAPKEWDRDRLRTVEDLSNVFGTPSRQPEQSETSNRLAEREAQWAGGNDVPQSAVPLAKSFIVQALHQGAQLLAAFAQRSAGAAEEAAIDQAVKDIQHEDLPEMRAAELPEKVAELEAVYGRDAAVELVARIVESDPAAFAQGVSAFGYVGDYSEHTKEILAQGVSLAYERAPESPYTSPERLAASLIDGMQEGQKGSGVSLLSDIVGRSSNDRLQADFVRSGLYQAQSLAQSDEYGHLQAGNLVASLAPAVRGSALAAQVVIDTTEILGMGPMADEMHAPGVDSLNWVLNQFASSGTPTASGRYESGFVTFMNAAVPADAPPYPGAPFATPQTPLTDQQSFSLFLAVSGDDGLLKADGVGGKENPEGTALTARLFENYYDKWIDPNGLNITEAGTIPADGISGKVGGLYKDVDISGRFENFFQEAMIESDENGPYRAGLTAFVLEHIFQAYGTDTPLSNLLGGAGEAAANSASLLTLLGGAEGDLLQELANASEENKQIISFLVGGGFAVLGAYTGGAPGALAGSKVGQVLMGYVIGKAEGTIEEGLVAYLVSQNVDPKQAELISGYLGDPAAVAAVLQAEVGDGALSAAQLTVFVNTFESNLDSGAVNALQTALESLNNDVGVDDETKEGIRDLAEDPRLTAEQTAALNDVLRDDGLTSNQRQVLEELLEQTWLTPDQRQAVEASFAELSAEQRSAIETALKELQEAQ